MDISATWIWIVILFDEAFKYDDGEKFWGYVGTSTELLCLEFCNFMQCDISHPTLLKKEGEA
jgi:hypothetical protein